MSSYELPEYLWTPQRTGLLKVIDAIYRKRNTCLFGPTGSGKTTIATVLFRWAVAHGLKGIFYINRRLLIPQTAARFAQEGLHYGIRAAEYEDQFDSTAPIQIASADTERSRVLKSEKWSLFDADIVVVDEAHIQKGDTMRQLLDLYHQKGAKWVLLTATPIGLAKWADELIVSGTLQEYRDCKALVPAKVFSHGQPDMAKIKRNATGEYIQDGERKRIYTQSIVGSVI